METKILLPSETTILHEKRQALGITPIEYMIIDALYKNPKLRLIDIANFIGLTVRHTIRLINGLVIKGLLLKVSRGIVAVSDRWFNEVIMQHDKMSSNMTNFHDIMSCSPKEEESNKEKEYINILSSSKKGEIQEISPLHAKKVKKIPTCPLLTKPHLILQYPEGHKECAEFLLSLEELLGMTIIHKGVWFKEIHNALGVGYSFDDISSQISRMVKDAYWKKRGWSMIDVTKEMERRPKNAPGQT